MIVKVQVSLASSDGKPKYLVYNEDQSVTYQDDMFPALASLMAGRPKAYFTAELRDGKVLLGAEVKAQSW